MTTQYFLVIMILSTNPGTAPITVLIEPHTSYQECITQSALVTVQASERGDKTKVSCDSAFPTGTK